MFLNKGLPNFCTKTLKTCTMIIFFLPFNFVFTSSVYKTISDALVLNEILLAFSQLTRYFRLIITGLLGFLMDLN